MALHYLIIISLPSAVHHSPPRAIKTGTGHMSRYDLLSRQVLIPQELAQFGPRLLHHWVLLGTPLPHPRLVPPRTPRVDHQLRHLLPLLGAAQPPQRVDEADPIRFDTLTARRLAHRHSHQVVCQGIHRQFLEHAIHCHALQHIHLHRLLQRLQVFLRLPAIMPPKRSACIGPPRTATPPPTEGRQYSNFIRCPELLAWSTEKQYAHLTNHAGTFVSGSSGPIPRRHPKSPSA